MSSLSKQEQLRQLIDEQQEHIRRTFPTHRDTSIIALTRAKDWHYLMSQDALTITTMAHGSYLSSSGWYKALQVCFDNATEYPGVSPLTNKNKATFSRLPCSYLFSCSLLAAATCELLRCGSTFHLDAIIFLYL